MTPDQYHSKFFPKDASYKQLGLRTYACATQSSVFGCPERPPVSSLEELKIIKIKTKYARLDYYVLLGRDNQSAWNELAICNNKDLLTIWRDVHYGNVIAKH